MFTIKITDSDKHFKLKVQDDKDDALPVDIEESDEIELLTPNKIKKKTKRIAWILYRDFRDKAKLYGRAIIHNIGSTELQIRQTIERYTRKIEHRTTHEERINMFTKVIKGNPQQFAKDLLFLEQRAKDLDAQLIGINLLVGRGYSPDFSQKHNLKDIILRCASSFVPALKSNNSRIEFKDLDNIEIETDFRLFNCAMYHFFDNAQKYIKPNADIIISVNFEKKELFFTMVSRAIEHEEKDNIFKEGFNGIHSGNLKGEGLGLYIFSLVLDKLDSIPNIDFDEKTRLGLDSIIYQENIFKIKFPPDTLYTI